MTSDAEASPPIAIIDYGMGNLRSVYRAFLEVGASAVIVNEPEEVVEFQALVFPGQGAIVDAMRRLKERRWDAFIRDWIAGDRPFFGICLGLQALFEHSEEGDTPALGVFSGKVRRFTFDPLAGLKVPHMGWNQARFMEDDPLLSGIKRHSEQFYFVHSYFVDCHDAGLVWATTRYGDVEFCSAIRRGNLVATQFHPEKSQAAGLALYRNFVSSLGAATGGT